MLLCLPEDQTPEGCKSDNLDCRDNGFMFSWESASEHRSPWNDGTCWQ